MVAARLVHHVKNASHQTLTRGAIWSIASFGIAQVTRLATNVVLTRLLAPELFGIMVIVNALKSGVELLSDVGIGQSIIYNKSADDPEFYNTAWTLQGIRGCILWSVACAATLPAAKFYQTPALLLVIPVASFVLVLSGFTSVSQFIVQKRLQVGRLSIYETILGTVWAGGQLTLAYFYPSIWALVFGLLLGSFASLIGSFFLLPGLKHSLMISKPYVWQILHFGKWIFLSSAVYFLANSFDRLYFARVFPLALLGVYGIARSISEILSILVLRMSNIVIFPFIAKHSDLARPELHAQLAPIRLKFLLIAAFVFSVSASYIDLAIKFVFDHRYHAASWMVPILIFGAWISILCSLNESALLGFGRPRYAAIGNSLKFFWLAIGLPVSFSLYGVIGSILVIAVSDIFRYMYISVGQVREHFSFRLQDGVMTLFMCALMALLEWTRWSFGLGTSFEGLINFY